MTEPLEGWFKEEQLELDLGIEENLSSKIVDRRKHKKKETVLKFTSDVSTAEIECGEDLNEAIHNVVEFCISIFNNKSYDTIETLKITDVNGITSQHNIR